MTSKSGDEKLLKSDLSRPVSLPKSGETHFSEKWGNIICFLQHVMCIMNVLRAKLVYRMFSVIKRDTEYTKQYKPAC